ncbi:hypothetical protein BDI4_340022 [Burkholderia diffusa]|nr:hypothetical protein BDI4_340022 [Burkholderia diffusa]
MDGGTDRAGWRCVTGVGPCGPCGGVAPCGSDQAGDEPADENPGDPPRLACGGIRKMWRVATGVAPPASTMQGWLPNLGVQRKEGAPAAAMRPDAARRRSERRRMRRLTRDPSYSTRRSRRTPRAS